MDLSRSRPPTARQIYALAAAFCAREGYGWPQSRADASDLLGELRRELGHPRAELEDNPLRARRPKWQRYAEWELYRAVLEQEIADRSVQADR